MKSVNGLPEGVSQVPSSFWNGAQCPPAHELVTLVVTSEIVNSLGTRVLTPVKSHSLNNINAELLPTEIEERATATTASLCSNYKCSDLIRSS